MSIAKRNTHSEKGITRKQSTRALRDVDSHTEHADPAVAFQHVTAPAPPTLPPASVPALQRAAGNRAVQGLIQRTLEVTAPDDKSEHEGDAVADQVMAMQDQQSAIERPTVHRHEAPQEERAKAGIQRLASEAALEPAEDFATRVAANKGAGTRLPDETRAFMEPRFGADFGSVRVHADSEAARMNQEVHAQAFTHGNDIYFNEGKYSPGSSDGQRLLAHELTHTIQQRGGRTQQQQNSPGVSVSPVSGPAPIARKKEDPSPFAGSAGTADVRAAQAGQEAGGFSPIKISTEYATKQAERKEEQMDSFRKEDIPFVSNNQEHYAYKKLIELRQEYVDDSTRITVAQGAFNDFVIPGTLANKSTAQFKRIQFELGYTDDTNAADDLSGKEKLTLAKHLDQKKLRVLNTDVEAKEKVSRGLRQEILGTSHTVQAALQKRAGILATEAKTKAEKEKAEIDEKIKAVKEGAETVATVIEAVSFAGFGAPEAIGEIAEIGESAEASAKGAKSALELGSKGAGLIGATAEFIMTQMYKEQIEKAKQEIEKAKVAEEHARKMDADLSYSGSMLQVQGQLQQLAGAMSELELALKARTDYFASLGAETDKATGHKAGSNVSQYLAYVAQANETKSHIETAKESASNSLGVMQTQAAEMYKHRSYAYVADAAGVWDDRARKVDADGPDLTGIYKALDGLKTFNRSADAELAVVDRVVGSLPAPV